MSSPAHRLATYADLLKVPDRFVAEIVDGELYASPRPALRHAVSSSVLGGDLNAAYQRGRCGPGGWWILIRNRAAPRRRHPRSRPGRLASRAVARGERTLRLQRARWVIVATHGGDTIVRAEPFEAVAIDLLELWGETRAPKSRPSPVKKR